jgi:cephalosporin-C deacetylase
MKCLAIQPQLRLAPNCRAKHGQTAPSRSRFSKRFRAATVRERSDANSCNFVLAVLFVFVSVAQAQPLSFTPFHKSGIYELGEKAGWTVTLAQDAGVPVSKYTYVIKKNNLDVIQEDTLDFSSGEATIETMLDEPAMLYVEVIPSGNRTPGSTIHLGAAIAPGKLQPSVPRPTDFDSFWNAKLKSLSEIPINPVLTPVSTSKAGVELHTVKLDSVGSDVQGYLAKPSRKGKFPALVIFQYAGVYALRPETVTDRAVEGWLAFDVDSHDIPPSEAAGVGKTYQSIGNTARETSYFLNMYLRDTRAIDYIASRPDWDGKTIVVTGTSMEGSKVSPPPG